MVTGEPLVYDNNGNTSLGIGTTGFVHDSIYYPEIVNSKAVRLYPSIDALNTSNTSYAQQPTNNLSLIHI